MFRRGSTVGSSTVEPVHAHSGIPVNGAETLSLPSACSLVDLPGFEGVLMLLHIHLLSGEADAFQPEARTLLPCGLSMQLDRASGAKNAMPWQMIRRIRTQKPCYSAMILRVAGRRCNSAIGADLACWNGENHQAKRAVALVFRTRCVPQQSLLRPLHGELIDARQSCCRRSPN